ncbi:MAG: DUF2142 domain-containing protein [Methylophilaceae bacterium]|nr:DUF2142 domain-containing protein [Methylophilaceae bacterium]
MFKNFFWIFKLNNKKSSYFIWLILFFSTIIIASLQPPFQTPDEFNHFKRAYLLSEGEVFFNTKDLKTGGNIDSGLLAFMNLYQDIPYHYENKYEKNILEKSYKISWTNQKEFSPFPNTAVYFPLIYLPQAMLINTSKFFSMNLYDSYLLVKFGCILFTFLLLLIANKIYSISYFGIALLGMPMSLYLTGSTHPEPFSYGLLLIVAALFLSSFNNKKKYSTYQNFIILIILLTLTVYRFYLFPFFILPLTLLIKYRDKVALLSFLLITLSSFLWTLYAANNVVGFEHWTNVDKPLINFTLDFFRIATLIFNTLVNTEALSFIFKSFVGILGWLDSPLNHFQYLFLLFFLVTIFFITNDFKRFKNLLVNENFIALIAIFFSVLLMFILLIFSATGDSSLVIQGIQGRYFIPLILVFSLLIKPIFYKNYLIILMISMSTIFSINNIVNRFYFVENWSGESKIIVGNASSVLHYGFLNSGRSFEQPFVAEANYLDSFRLRLATFRVHNHGLLKIDILNQENQIIFSKDKDLNDVNDNDWFYIDTEMLELTKDNYYTIRLTANPVKENKSITWWATNAQNSNKDIIYVDGKTINGSFAYELLFKLKKLDD